MMVCTIKTQRRISWQQRKQGPGLHRLWLCVLALAVLEQRGSGGGRKTLIYTTTSNHILCVCPPPPQPFFFFLAEWQSSPQARSPQSQSFLLISCPQDRTSLGKPPEQVT